MADIDKVYINKASKANTYIVTTVDKHYGFVDKIGITFVHSFIIHAKSNKKAYDITSRRLRTRYVLSMDPNYIPPEETDEHKDARYEVKARILLLAQKGTGNTIISKKMRNKLKLP